MLTSCDVTQKNWLNKNVKTLNGGDYNKTLFLFLIFI